MMSYAQALSTCNPKIPISGRRKELELLAHNLTSVADGKGMTVLITGEAGIGKTRLVEELSKLAESMGFSSTVGHCLPGPPCPYLPFQEALKSLGASSKRKDVISFAEGSNQLVGKTTSHDGVYKEIAEDLFTSDSGRFTADQAFFQRENIFFTNLEFIKTKARDSPILLILEDLHWADSATVQLLRFMASNIGKSQIMIVGTFRPEDLVEAEDKPTHPFLIELGCMRREGLIKEMRLNPLDNEAIENTLQALLGGTLDEKVKRRIAEEVEGNPLYALEIARLLVIEGTLEQNDGVWKFGENIVMSIPSNIKDVVLRRIERLSHPERQLIECASVVGVDFDPLVVMGVLQRNANEVIGAFNKIQQNNGLLVVSEDMFHFSHELIRKVCYEGISPQRRKELHKKIASVLESSYSEACSLSQLSYHFYEAGNNEKCFLYSVRAGKKCNAKCAGLEGVLYFRRALEIAPQNDSYNSSIREAKEGLGDSYYENADYQSSFNEFEGLLKDVASDDELARLFRKCSDCWAPQKLGKGDITKHIEYLHKALACIDVSRKERAEILRNASVEAIWRGDFKDANRLSMEAVKLLKEEGEIEIASWELSCHAFVYICEGNPVQALMELKDARTMLAERPWPRGEIENEFFQGMAYLTLGKDEAIECFAEARDLAEKLGDRYIESWIKFYVSLIFEMKGDYGVAETLAEHARNSAFQSNNPNLAAMIDSLLVHIYVATNQIEAAEDRYEEILRIVRPDLRVKSPVWGLIEIAKAELLSYKDDEGCLATFDNGIEFLTGVQMGSFYRGIARVWFAEGRFRKNPEIALRELLRARDDFSSLSNSKYVDKVNQMLAQIQVMD